MAIRLKDTLSALSNLADDGFSGLGIVIHDRSLDYERAVCLRGEFEVSPTLNLFSEQGRARLLAAAAKDNGGHDGFCMAFDDGTIDRVSQFLIPPVLPNLRPDPRRGARSYTALSFSTLAGVLVTGIISEDGSIAIYSNGKRVYDSKDGE